MCEKQAGEMLNLVFPLGNTFNIPETADFRPLLVGGGVGVAPLLFLGAELHGKGVIVNFLLGARTAKDLLLLDEFQKYGTVFVTTEDGSAGEKGFVTQHSIMNNEELRIKNKECLMGDSHSSSFIPHSSFNYIYTCGPTPMMKAVARYATARQIPCEVSLENTMACGVGACLCCVTKTYEGHKCVCTDGPVFNILELGNFI
jgi:dihydroorotate dehydrogenase electron transfer subunit